VGEAVLSADGNGPVDLNARFLQAVAYLIEWVKHIVTIGSALMVLSAAFLKDLVRGVGPPYSYVIAVLLVLSYSAMLRALWFCLAFIRRASRAVLTAERAIGSGEDLQDLKGHLDRAQGWFLASVGFFAGLVVTSLLAWALARPAEAAGTVRMMSQQ